MAPPSSGRLPPTHSLLLVHVFIKRNRNKSCSSDCPFSTFRLLIISGAELANLQHGDQGLAQVQGFWCLYFESYRCLDFLFWILWAVIRKRRCAPYTQARILEQIAISFSRGSSRPRNRTQELNTGLLHFRQIHYQLSYVGSIPGQGRSYMLRGQLSPCTRPPEACEPQSLVLCQREAT